MIAPDFPRVEIPGVEVTDAQREFVKEANEKYAEWRMLKVGMAYALIRRGAEPYGRPSAAEKARRRARGKRQRQARKLHR